ncbi:MAG: transposase zinc-binding domain-containing protein [Acidobacteriota bacterium]
MSKLVAFVGGFSVKGLDLADEEFAGVLPVVHHFGPERLRGDGGQELHAILHRPGQDGARRRFGVHAREGRGAQEIIEFVGFPETSVTSSDDARRDLPATPPGNQCLQDYGPEFQESYPYFHEKDHGPLRPVLERTVERFLECGIFRHGFARIRCSHCPHEYLLAFSCKTRYFCPACQAKRMAAFVQWVTQEILEPVEHCQYVWTIPKVLRGAFRRDRSLLGELSRSRLENFAGL